jgi:hypothetical protein
MGWKTLTEAAKAGPSLATWERRIERDRVPHYLDAVTGRRLVWIDATSGQRSTEPDLGELRQTVTELRALIADLRSERASASDRAKVVPVPRATTPRRVPPRRRAPPIRLRTPRLQVPARPEPLDGLARKLPATFSELEVARIMRLRATCDLGDKALQRAAGLASNWFWKVKTGQCRSVLAAPGWSRLEGFLSAAPRRQVA